VLLEIESRAKGADVAYPFEIVGSSVLQTKGNLKAHVAYIFCLLLSYFGWKSKKKAPVNPRLLFEKLSFRSRKTVYTRRSNKFWHWQIQFRYIGF
jgi:hypothetical protein